MVQKLLISILEHYSGFRALNLAQPVKFKFQRRIGQDDVEDEIDLISLQI